MAINIRPLPISITKVRSVFSGPNQENKLTQSPQPKTSLAKNDEAFKHTRNTRVTISKSDQDTLTGRNEKTDNNTPELPAEIVKMKEYLERLKEKIRELKEEIAKIKSQDIPKDIKDAVLETKNRLLLNYQTQHLALSKQISKALKSAGIEDLSTMIDLLA
ncbi:hypothetical protein ACSLBF_18555 (plasmid) [Pseudoalteromonas sp. T1lg65]|uniref:hypothetical protein n=1 Tax=Pseudoalteromonas sp. T1lg65 TaxID=2077101 RepID=UPI003F7A39DB